VLTIPESTLTFARNPCSPCSGISAHHGPEPSLEKANHDDRAIRWLDMAQFPIGGRERTEGEFRRLFSEAGFELATVLHTLIPDVCLIEGRPR
jgi:hypothetical protein